MCPTYIDWTGIGLAAHHAIHQMALVQWIATKTLGLDAVKDLPPRFVRAPSKINFDNNQPGI
jgi:hypothetical protein